MIATLRYLPLILCLFLKFSSFAQCGIQGKLTDTLHVAIPFNAVGLVNVKDSSVYKGVMTDQDGNYCFERLKKGTYLIKVSAIGFNTFYSDQITYDSITPLSVPVITLKPAGVNLNEVSVSAQKRTVEFKNGNITVNVEGTALAVGNSVYDLLARLPGVTVNESDISIQGRGGVKILIDGKLQQISGSQLINVLKSMNASQVEKIEVLKKPPVKYDAEGTGGMINIKTKKLKLVGFSGDVFASFSQGFYGNPGGGFSLNYKGRRFNFFSGFSAEQEWRRHENDFRNTITYNSTETTLHQNYVEKQHNNLERYNLGADWFINKRNSVGIKMSGAFGMGNEDRIATTTVSDSSLGYNAIRYNFRKPNPWIYPEFNLNAEHLFDTTGTALRFSANYYPYWDIYAAEFDNHLIGANDQEVTQPSVFRTSNTLLFNTLSGMLDFEKTFKKELKLETGLKQTYQEMMSDYIFENMDPITGEYSTDPAFTNVYTYRQNISAGYINLSKDYKKVSFQLGVRGENTIINTISKTNNTGFTRQYFNLFPMASFDYRISDNHNLQLSYNKRINRPDYNSFNPFRIFRSLLSSQQGNPYLKPEYSHSIDLTYSYKTWMYHTLSFSRIYNAYIGYNQQNDSSKVTITTSTNLQYADVYSYNLFLQKDITKWWSANLNANVYYISAKGLVNDLPYTIGTLGFNPGLFSRFAFKNDFSIELNAFYMMPVLEGVNHVKARNMVHLGFKKSFLDKKLSFSLSFNDILFGWKYSFSTDYQGQRSNGTLSFDTRRINIGINYNFGKLKVQQREVKDKEASGKVSK